MQILRSSLWLARRAFVLPLVIVGCGEADDAGPGADLAEARESLLAAANAQADSSRSGTVVDAISRMISEDGILVSPAPELMRGREEIRAGLSADTVSARAVATWHVVRADVSADGHHGYTYGYFETQLPDGDARAGKYSAFWRRESDGRWVIMALRRVARSTAAVSYELPAAVAAAASTRWAGRAQDADALRDSVAATDRAFSDHATTHTAADAFLAYAAPDAAHISAGDAIVFGAEAIAAPLRDMPAGSSFSWLPDLVEVASGGDLAYTTGISEARARQPDGSQRVTGTFRYFSIWKRQPDGSWKFIVEG